MLIQVKRTFKSVYNTCWAAFLSLKYRDSENFKDISGTASMRTCPNIIKKKTCF